MRYLLLLSSLIWLTETFEKKFVKTAVSQLSKDEFGEDFYLQHEKTSNKADTPKLADALKKIAYSTLPQYEIYTPDSLLVNLPEYLLKSRPYKDKPTLIVTFLYPYCNPCTRIIDSLLNAGIALHYNVILINRDGTKYSYTEKKKELAARLPNYNEDAILLYDPNNQLADIDNEATPTFLWLDKNLDVVGSFTGYRIYLSDITGILSKIEQAKIYFGSDRYYDQYLIPCEGKDAKIRFNISSKSDIVKLALYKVNNVAPELEINYISNRKGKLIYQP